MPQKKKKNNNTRNKISLDMVYADKSLNQEYGYVDKVFGNCHFRVKNILGEERLASLCGLIKRKCRVMKDDLVLLEPTCDDSDAKYQIIFKYSPEQKKLLEREGKLKRVDTHESSAFDDDGFVFEDEVQVQQTNTMNVDEFFVDGI